METIVCVVIDLGLVLFLAFVFLVDNVFEALAAVEGRDASTSQNMEIHFKQ
jgi:hypothetical protein